MNFDCVGRDSKGQMYMKFHKPFSIVEQIQMLERSILVNSFAYYELNENILSDFQYDANAIQLSELKNSKEASITITSTIIVKIQMFIIPAGLTLLKG